MNKVFNIICLFAVSLSVMTFSYSCKKNINDEPMPSPIPSQKKISLNAELGDATSKTILFGGSVPLNISISDKNTDGTSIVASSNINVSLKFTGNGVKADATGSEQITASDVFSNWTNNLVIEKGHSSVSLTLNANAKNKYSSINGVFEITSRGLTVKNGVSLSLSIVDVIPVALLYNGENYSNDLHIVTGKKFTLGVSLTSPASSDVVVNIAKQENANVTIADLPESLTITKGQSSATSSAITVTLAEGQTTSPLNLTLSTADNMYVMSNTTFTLNVDALSASYGSKQNDERWVYSDPDKVYMSSNNQEKVKEWGTAKDLVLMTPGTPHVNPELAAEGWRFYNALEFSPIDALTKNGAVNSDNNRVCRYLGEQNVEGLQKYQAVENSKFSTMTDQGYLSMWSAKGENLQANWWTSNNNKAPHGERKYGVSACHMSKFRTGDNKTYNWIENQVRILPGMRIEIRLKLSGQLYSFNPAVWLQGNKESQDLWPYYGEIDILESPQSRRAGEYNGVYQTFHWSGGTGENTPKNRQKDNPYNKTSGEVKVDVSKFNIYWVDYIDENTIALGVNGYETNRIRRSDYSGNWPFAQSYNDEGFHLLLTMGCNSDWATGLNNSIKGAYDQFLQNIVSSSALTNPDTPRMDIDFIRFYIRDGYHYVTTSKKGDPKLAKNTPMY